MYKCTHCRVVASSSGECAKRRPAPTWAKGALIAPTLPLVAPLRPCLLAAVFDAAAVSSDRDLTYAPELVNVRRTGAKASRPLQTEAATVHDGARAFSYCLNPGAPATSGRAVRATQPLLPTTTVSLWIDHAAQSGASQPGKISVRSLVAPLRPCLLAAVFDAAAVVGSGLDLQYARPSSSTSARTGAKASRPLHTAALYRQRQPQCTTERVPFLTA